MKFDMSKVSTPKDEDILEEEETEEKPQAVREMLTDILKEEETEEKPQAEKELLTEHITIKLPPSEKRELKKQAEAIGLKLSPLVRSILKKHDYI